MAKTDDIKEHMEVLGADGKHVGTVDRIEGADTLKLAKGDPQSGGQHHLIPMSFVDHVDADVHLNKPAREVLLTWRATA
ncbi:MAG TPA: DUF2171 domain-containing protein [Pseudolabrys sp.]|nr:DUF2171 domain-containing protein [Pseudolabrys sp.]